VKILLTAFEPFDERSTNASMLLLEQLEESSDTNKVILPVTYDTKVLEEVIHTYDQYDLVIHFGEAANRKKISLEQIALNRQGATIKDNLGVFKKDEIILGKGPLAFETKIDLKSIANKANCPFLEISYHAGTYICNLVYYTSLNYIQNQHLKTKCLFIHCPLFGESTVDLVEAKEVINGIINHIKKDILES